MASITLRLKSHHHKPSSNHTFSLLFSSSSSSSSNNNNNNGGNSGEKPYPFSAYFTEIKSKLKQQQQQQQSPSFSNINNVFTPQGSSTPSKVESLDEIRKNLSEFRRRSSVSTPESPPTFQRNVRNPNPNPNIVGVNKVLSFEKIRSSLRNLNATVSEKGKSMNEQMSLNNYRQNLRMRPTMEEQQQQRGGGGGGVGGIGGGHMVIGGSLENLPANVFGREMKEKEGKSGKDGGGKAKEEEDEMELITSYTYDQLGEKLRKLRPEGKGKKGGKNDWFSLSELGERLKKLKEIELKKLDDSGVAFKELRTTMRHLRDDKEESNNAPIQSIDILSSPSFMLSPPKENLVEKYFHPDNMSAEEKLKLELKRIRDEFKMHESDCGSTRVQIAQLTTKILHLSSALHKKDKHSRRGLLAKVQQRKKLLKYLRRTDWESYSFVLSKLGLRDNPDYKN